MLAVTTNERRGIKELLHDLTSAEIICSERNSWNDELRLQSQVYVRCSTSSLCLIRLGISHRDEFVGCTQFQLTNSFL